MRQECKKCIFFKEQEQTKDIGYCRRYPPTTNKPDSSTSTNSFPTISAESICGEFSPLPKFTVPWGIGIGR